MSTPKKQTPAPPPKPKTLSVAFSKKDLNAIREQIKNNNNNNTEKYHTPALIEEGDPPHIQNIWQKLWDAIDKGKAPEASELAKQLAIFYFEKDINEYSNQQKTKIKARDEGKQAENSINRVQMTVGAKKTKTNNNNTPQASRDDSQSKLPVNPRHSRSIATLLENDDLVKNKQETHLRLQKKTIGPNPLMSKEKNREMTFSTWTLKQPPVAKIVQAGFYYEKTNSTLYGNDRTLCFACGVEVNNWLPTDQPLVRHLMQNHDCPHVQGIIVPELRNLLNKLKRTPPSYTAQQLIGKGSFGEVWYGKSELTGESVAIKKMPLSIAYGKYQAYEIINHDQISGHKNLVQFIDAFLVEGVVWSIIEFANYGCLTRITGKSPMLGPVQPKDLKGRLYPGSIAFILREVLEGLAYIHSKKFLHRDLKSDNVLLNSLGEVKLGDFGFLVELTEQRNYRQTVIGTPYWMSPQVITPKMKYSYGADIWALGILLVEMLEGEPPHHEISPSEAKQRIVQEQELPLRFEDQIKETLLLDFLKRCTVRDEEKRASAEELLKHPLLSKACSLTEFKRYLAVALGIKQQQVKKQPNAISNTLKKILKKP